MVRLYGIVIAFGIGVASVSALAQSPDSTVTPTPVTKPIKEKKVCRDQTPIGSKIPVSTCHTAAQWTQIDQEERSAVAANRNLSPTSNGK